MRTFAHGAKRARRFQVSLAHWNQDEEYGGFGGPHCMIPGGYSQVMEALASGLDIRFNTPVNKVLIVRWVHC